LILPLVNARERYAAWRAVRHQHINKADLTSADVQELADLEARTTAPKDALSKGKAAAGGEEYHLRMSQSNLGSSRWQRKKNPTQSRYQALTTQLTHFAGIEDRGILPSTRRPWATRLLAEYFEDLSRSSTSARTLTGQCDLLGFLDGPIQEDLHTSAAVHFMKTNGDDVSLKAFGYQEADGQPIRDEVRCFIRNVCTVTFVQWLACVAAALVNVSAKHANRLDALEEAGKRRHASGSPEIGSIKRRAT
jgi:hypothetical protein